MTITLDTQVTMLYYYRIDHILHIKAHTITETHTGEARDKDNFRNTRLLIDRTHKHKILHWLNNYRYTQVIIL